MCQSQSSWRMWLIAGDSLALSSIREQDPSPAITSPTASLRWRSQWAGSRKNGLLNSSLRSEWGIFARAEHDPCALQLFDFFIIVTQNFTQDPFIVRAK